MCGSDPNTIASSFRKISMTKSMKQFGQFLLSMLRVGCIGFGGGSALIPVIEKEIVEKQGLDRKDNIDKDVVVASITPGALPVEIAASIGRRKFGIKGMIAGAVMMALPGAVFTVLLVTVLSVFQDKILNVVNIVSVGVTLFIIYLLVSYILNMLRECGKDGMIRKVKAIVLMMGIFVMTFFLSTVQVLFLAFFGIFFTRGNYSRKNMAWLSLFAMVYILIHWFGIPANLPMLRYGVDIVMVLLAAYGICCNVRDTKWQSKRNWNEILKDVGVWAIFLFILILPAVLVSSDALAFSVEGICSAWVSFGGGDAYLTIADGFFVEGKVILAGQYYNHIVPAVNVLPGSILCKTLAAVGYYAGWNISGSAVVGILFAIAGFACSIAASCSFFMLAYHLYDYLVSLQVFQIISKWIRPIIGGLLIKIMLELCSQGVVIILSMI